MIGRNRSGAPRRGAAVVSTLILFFNVFYSVQAVSAAVAPLMINFSQSLIPGTDNAIPQVSDGKVEDQVFLSWPMDSVGGVSFTHGSYKLSYYIDMDKRIEFTARKNGDSVDIRYDAARQDGTPYAPIGYQVHSNVNGSGRPNFLPIKTFLDSGYNVG
ncbi:MAG: hypothetical protein LBS84_03075, partial [Clostridiales bacterium]|nr:hypothetical protein [Clostridiales bacterium]